MQFEIISLQLLKNITKSLLGIFLGIALAACGGSGGGGPALKTGVFLDSPVVGIGYTTTANLSGSTNSAGEFQYLPGDEVVFFVGNIRLPSVLAAEFVTPLDMGAAKDLNDPVVINILRFLQSLDSDGDPKNGIHIPPPEVFPNFETHTLDFGLSVADFEAALLAFLKTLQLGTTPVPVSVELAQAQFEGTVLQQMAGTYSGTFTGDPGGTWRMTMDLSGEVTGTIAGERIGQFNVETKNLLGRVTGEGKLHFEAVDGNERFSGLVTLSGKVSGTWTRTGFSESGSFSGEKEPTELSFNGPKVPGVYDFVSDGGDVALVYTFSALENKGSLDFKDGGAPVELVWFVDFEGKLMVVLAEAGRRPDRISLIEGTRINGGVTIESDLDRDGEYDTSVTGTFVKR